MNFIRLHKSCSNHVPTLIDALLNFDENCMFSIESDVNHVFTLFCSMMQFVNQENQTLLKVLLP